MLFTVFVRKEHSARQVKQNITSMSISLGGYANSQINTSKEDAYDM
jgi:hypothetical protein